MKSRRFISIFLCVTLLLTLPAPAAGQRLGAQARTDAQCRIQNP